MELGKVELREDGILRFIASSNLQTINLYQLEELLKVFIEMVDGKPRPFYTDNGKMQKLGHRERQFIGNNLHLFASASAIKETSGGIRLISGAINHLFPPKVVMRMFKSEDEAIAWLKSL